MAEGEGAGRMGEGKKLFSSLPLFSPPSSSCVVVYPLAPVSLRTTILPSVSEQLTIHTTKNRHTDVTRIWTVPGLFWCVAVDKFWPIRLQSIFHHCTRHHQQQQQTLWHRTIIWSTLGSWTLSRIRLCSRIESFGKTVVEKCVELASTESDVNWNGATVWEFQGPQGYHNQHTPFLVF